MMTKNATTDKTGIMMIVKNIMIVLTMFALAAFLGNGFNLIGWSYIVQVKYIKNENFIQALTKLRNLPIVH